MQATKPEDGGAAASTILVDGAHLLKKTGTGIASYARTLAATLRSAGCGVGVLYGQPVRAGVSDHLLMPAMQIFGNAPGEHRLARGFRLGLFALAAHLKRTQRATATEVAVRGIDLSALVPPQPTFDHVFNASALYERADMFFRLKQRFTEVAVPRGIAAAHWTYPLPVKARDIPNIYTIHDLIPMQFPYFVIDRAGAAAKLHASVAREADLIVTVSESSKRQIVSLLGVPEERMCVTYQATPRPPDIAQPDAERLVTEVYGAEPGRYALFLGAIEPKKNLQRLIEAYLLAGLDIPLLIAGPLGWLYGDDLDLIKTISTARSRDHNGLHPDELELIWTIANDAAALPGGAHEAAMPRLARCRTASRLSGIPIRYLGFLPRKHADALLKCARIFVFPSVCEGFGLPVLEAMQLGVPVLTSSTSSLPEVAGDAAVLVDPLRVSDLAKGIRKLANDADLRAELARRGRAQAAKFSAEAYRHRLADAYRKVGVEWPSGGSSREREQIATPTNMTTEWGERDLQTGRSDEAHQHVCDESLRSG